MSLSVKNMLGGSGGGSNPNLLDNGWFTVNQRGFTSISASAVYTVDRWKTYGRGSVSVSNNIITIQADSSNYMGINQPLEDSLIAELLGKAVTVSILKDDGTVLHVTLHDIADGTENYQYLDTNIYANIDLRTSTRRLLIMCENGSNISIRAIKLEYGSTSTLALDSAPNYATELLKCQRYYYKMPSGLIGSALARNNTSANVFIMLPTTMRIIPTITIHGTINLSDGVNANPITSFGTIGNGYNTVSCLANSTGLTQYRSYVLAIPSGDTNYLDISADL